MGEEEIQRLKLFAELRGTKYWAAMKEWIERQEKLALKKLLDAEGGEHLKGEVKFAQRIVSAVETASQQVVQSAAL